MDIQEIVNNACGKFRAALGKMKLNQSETWAFELEPKIIPALQKIIREAVNDGTRSDKGGAENSGDYPESMGKAWYNGDDPFPFGKYGPPPKGSGKTFDEIPKSYFEWLMTQDWVEKWEGVTRYARGEKPPVSTPDGENPFKPTQEDESEAPF